MPAKRVQGGISLRLRAPRRFLAPFLIAGLKAEIKEIIIKPEPKDTSAASIGFPMRYESSPLARACTAIINPEIAARISKRALLLFWADEFTKNVCRQTCVYLQSNPSTQKELLILRMLGGLRFAK